MTERRVLITGLGAVAPGGIGIQQLFKTVLAGGRSVKPIELFDAASFPCRIAGELEDFKASAFLPRSYRKAVKVMARDIQIAVAAADLAVRDAGITTLGIDPEKVDIDSARLGCNIGAGLLCADLDELGLAVNTAVTDGRFDFKLWGREGMNNLTPLWLLKYLPNMLACHVTIIHGAKGPSNTITCGEASGLLAVGEATRTIARGAADAAIAGGAESKVDPIGLLRQSLLGRLSTSGNDDPPGACRPFDKAAAGTVIGEGGGLLLLEEHDRAVGRSARVYAEVAGFGAACDPEGADYTRPTVGGLERAMAVAMADAGIEPEQIDLLVPQGTGVAGEDAAEACAIRGALGRRAGSVPVSPLAGGFGDLFAGASAVNLALAAMATHAQTIPPAVNFETPAEGCGLAIARRAEQAEINYVLTGGFGVGGQSAAVVLKRYAA